LKKFYNIFSIAKKLFYTILELKIYIYYINILQKNRIIKIVLIIILKKGNITVTKT